MDEKVQESFPLCWPEGQVRTRIQDRKAMGGWKKNANQYREALLKELERMGASSMVLSTNVPLNLRGSLQAIEPRDPGVAVYFVRPTKEDYSWQDILEIHDPAPTIEQINQAYRTKSKLYHPEAGGDVEMFRTLTMARDRAKEWALQKEKSGHHYVIACDLFKEVRWNICAIRMTIGAFRQIERCGTSSILERAFQGFQQITAGGPIHVQSTTA